MVARCLRSSVHSTDDLLVSRGKAFIPSHGCNTLVCTQERGLGGPVAGNQGVNHKGQQRVTQELSKCDSRTRPAALASLGNLLEMQILGPHARPAVS